MIGDLQVNFGIFRKYSLLAEMVLFGALAKAGGTALVRLNKSENKLEVSVEETEAELEEA